MWQLQRELIPNLVTQRAPNQPRRRQDDYITAGPNHIWSCDGHDKLAQFGIQIYGAIDAYSRKIVWFYCGNANRSQFSVGRQYLQAVKQLGYAPRLLRTDKGSETIIMAAIHYQLYLAFDSIRINQPSNAHINECYIYGSSTANVRIERLWSQLRHVVTGKFILLFKWLADKTLFQHWLFADQICLLFVFMPLVRAELAAYVASHNEYPIRRQKNRPYHVPGVPNNLYEQPPYATQCGFPIDEDIIREWQPHSTQFGRLILT